MKGTAEELWVAAWLTNRGYIVSLPTFPAPYDLVWDNAAGLERVQVKKMYHDVHARQRGYLVDFKKRYGQRETYSSDDCDWVAAVSIDHNALYLISVEVIKDRAKGRFYPDGVPNDVSSQWWNTEIYRVK